MININSELIDIKKSLLLIDIYINIYIFGSFLYSEMPNDIDILVIYIYEYELFYIKNAFANLITLYPIDVYYMTATEEQELNFIFETKATELL